jgi:hypothetical protein
MDGSYLGETDSWGLPILSTPDTFWIDFDLHSILFKVLAILDAPQLARVSVCDTMSKQETILKAHSQLGIFEQFNSLGVGHCILQLFEPPEHNNRVILDPDSAPTTRDATFSTGVSTCDNFRQFRRVGFHCEQYRSDTFVEFLQSLCPFQFCENDQLIPLIPLPYLQRIDVYSGSRGESLTKRNGRDEVPDGVEDPEQENWLGDIVIALNEVVSRRWTCNGSSIESMNIYDGDAGIVIWSWELAKQGGDAVSPILKLLELRLLIASLLRHLLTSYHPLTGHVHEDHVLIAGGHFYSR